MSAIKKAEAASDREIVITRLIDAPVARVWRAWTEAGDLLRWWAPKACSTPSCDVDLRPGGRFHFCMRMPDGKDIWGVGVYKEIVKHMKIIYVDSFADAEGNPVPPARYGMSADHPEETLVTVAFVKAGPKTKVTIRHAFPEAVKERKGTEQGWNEMLDKLAGHLAQKPAFELELERVIDSPRARVYEAWTKPEQMSRWFAPKPFQLIIKSMDLRPGGRFSMAMRGPNGEDFPFTGTYREIDPPAKLSWTGEFPDMPKDTIVTVITFAEEGGKTRVRARQTFSMLSPTAQHAIAGAKEGWSMTLDQLVQFVEKGI